jgi:hypothetical protein
MTKASLFNPYFAYSRAKPKNKCCWRGPRARERREESNFSASFVRCISTSRATDNSKECLQREIVVGDRLRNGSRICGKRCAKGNGAPQLLVHRCIVSALERDAELTDRDCSLHFPASLVLRSCQKCRRVLTVLQNLQHLFRRFDRLHVQLLLQQQHCPLEKALAAQSRTNSLSCRQSEGDVTINSQGHVKGWGYLEGRRHDGEGSWTQTERVLLSRDKADRRRASTPMRSSCS